MTTRSVMVRIRGDVSDLNRALLGAGRGVKGLSDQLETSNDRATWLAQGLTAIVPAVAPIAAQAAPALAGMATQMTAATIAAGTTVLAFQGVGDAMKQSIAYEAEPTAANLEKLNEAMAKLSPQAQQFVTQLNDMLPQLRTLKETAQENMFPGFSEGLDSLITLLPRARDLIGSVAEVNGRMAAEGAASLAGDDWREFFDYLQRNAAPTTAELGRTIGNVTKGLADLLVAFEPTERAWSQGMLNMSRSFADWAAGLDETEGFQEFLDYLETTGPQVLDTVGSLAEMFLEIGEAAAPLGGPTLAAVRGFAEAVSAIADTPLGPVILGGVAAVSALSRALAVSQLLFKQNADGAQTMVGKATAGYRGQMAAVGKMPAAYREAAAAQRTLVAAQGEAHKVTGQYVGQLQAANLATSKGVPRSARAQASLADSLSKVELANYGVRDATEKAQAAEAKRGATLRSSAAGLGKSAGAAAALTVATSGMADGIGLSNTATLGLMGTMAGVPGIVGGVVVGSFLDAKAASAGWTKSLEDMNAAARNSDFAGLVTGLRAMNNELDDLGKISSVGDLFGDGIKTLGQIFSGNNPFNDVGEVAKAQLKVQQLSDTYLGLATALGRPLPANASMKQIEQVAISAAPALRELGISATDLSKMSNVEFARAAEEIRSIMQAADSTSGRTKALGEAVSGLDDDLMSTADSASQMAQALNALVGPGLSAEEATDQYRSTLRGLRDELSNSAGFTANTAGAEKNRAVTRAFMGDLTNMLSKQAEAGAGAGKIAQGVNQARDAFIREGVAAGISAKEMRRRANAIGLTPKLVATIFKAAGIDPIAQKARGLARTLNGIPKQKLTRILANGIPNTEAGMRRLQRRYNLTPKQVQTLAKLRDQTPAVQRAVLRRLAQLDRTTARPSASLRDNASGRIANIRQSLSALNGQTAFTTAWTIYKSRKDSAAGNLFSGAETFAAGGMWGNSPDIKDGHVAHLARGGTYRVFAEPETKGEAYIPLADDWRRPRARDIASATVGMLGGSVEWFAAGGAYAPPSAQLVSGMPGSGSLRVQAGATQVQVFIDGEEVRSVVYDVLEREATQERAYANTASVGGR